MDHNHGFVSVETNKPMLANPRPVLSMQGAQARYNVPAGQSDLSDIARSSLEPFGTWRVSGPPRSNVFELGGIPPGPAHAKAGGTFGSQGPVPQPVGRVTADLMRGRHGSASQSEFESNWQRQDPKVTNKHEVNGVTDQVSTRRARKMCPTHPPPPHWDSTQCIVPCRVLVAGTEPSKHMAPWVPGSGPCTHGASALSAKDTRAR